MIVSEVNDFFIVVNAASGTAFRATEELAPPVFVAPPAAALPPCVLAEEPPLVDEVLNADVLPFVADVCRTVLPVVEPESAPVCTELLSCVFAEVVARVDVFDVVALMPLVLLADSCVLVAEEDEVPLWLGVPPLFLEEELVPFEPCR